MSPLQLRILTGLLMGVVFGFALEKSRVFEPGIIVGQMQLRNFIMLKVFLTAVATGAVVLAVLNGFGFVKLQPKAALYAADIVGGLILGAGIALAGACPGTTLAQIGVGYRDAIFTLRRRPVRRGCVLLRAAVARQVADRHRAEADLHGSRRHSLLARRDRARRGHRRHPGPDGEAAAVARRSWRGCRWQRRQRHRNHVAVWRPRNDRDGSCPSARSDLGLSRKRLQLSPQADGQGGMRSRGAPAFVLRWTVGADEIRPVPIFEAGAGRLEPAFRTIASFAVRSEPPSSGSAAAAKRVLTTSGQMSNSILIVLSTSIERQWI